ncbi:MAG: chromosome segregation protein SMC [Planctomycetota bacterium]|jgi:chromosome segregation protein
MKLRELILHGFKSFADQTEFEFHDGITCVVGPNGCGKSNVVDAIKWVLGEQSAKSLRGTEMADVIFNGSATRRPSGMAEVTLVFDDEEGALKPNIADDELVEGTVSVSRRLYRNGQSEYLINKAICRLRDVREMFMDTGIGVDAYSVIEQGRVEMFLNASTEDRRGIFDEAAGISKYKARKKEALRKLERVEQNLLRLNDVLAEVEKRLRSVKLQAGKARSYEAHTQRLKELKSLHYLAQYHEQSARRRDLQQHIDVANDRLAAAARQLEQLQNTHRGVQVESADLERTARQLQEQLAAANGRIDTAAQRRDMLTARVGELGEQIVAASRHCEATEAKLSELTDQANERQAQLAQIKIDADEMNSRYEATRSESSAAASVVAHLQAQLEDEKDGTVDLLRRTAQLHSDVKASAVRRENLHNQQERLSGRAKEIADALTALLTARADDQAKLADVAGVLEDSQTRLDEARQQATAAGDSEQAFRNDLNAARERRSGLLSRIETLEEMERHLEGIGQGTRDVLAAVRAGEISGVRGMLGDFIETDMDHALVVEAALAGADQQLLAEPGAPVAELVERLSERLGETGAAELLRLDSLAPLTSDMDLADCPRSIARVIDWVRFEPWLSPVMWRLLGQTLAVASFADAFAAADRLPRGYRFVTRDGDVLEADGRIRLGLAHRSAGVIRRRSELAELRQQLADIDERLTRLEGQLQDAHNQREHYDERIKALRTAIYEATTERIELENRISHLNDRIEQLQREEPIVAGDLAALAEDIEAAVKAEHDARQKATELDDLRVQREQEVERLTADIATAEQRRAELVDHVTELKMSLVQMDEKTHALSDSLKSIGMQQAQMQTDLANQRREIAANRQRREEAQQSIEKAAAELTDLQQQREQFSRDVEDVEATRASLAERLAEIDRQIDEGRAAHDARKDELNEQRMDLGEVEVRIENTITRASEEMGMDLLTLSETYEHDGERDWESVEAEIAELRQKIDRLGNVNLDAIGEQDELEQRRAFLTGQLTDIQDSHKQLNDLIDRINVESRQRFLAIFTTVRENFQELFRKLFGGGRADLILLDEENMLECGIEIVARPPGKDLRSLTLLSGGEKAKTALALIFAFFKSHPSPFCLLDEVDAPLDEANTEQFARMLNDFAVDTQFIIISHAKRTMSMVDILYGVTMQEPGVSKRISVRFDQVDQAMDEDLQAAEA